MTKRTTHRRRQSYPPRISVTASIALICVTTASVLAILIVYRADVKTMAVSVALVGTFLSTAAGLLAENRSHGRATDPSDTHAGATVETTTTTTTPPEQEPEG